MQIEQICNLVVIFGLSFYVVVKTNHSDNSNFRNAYTFGVGVVLVFAQFAFNKIFANDAIRLATPTIEDILLVREISFDVALVVVGYMLILCGSFSYLKFLFLLKLSLKNHDQYAIGK